MTTDPHPQAPSRPARLSVRLRDEPDSIALTRRRGGTWRGLLPLFAVAFAVLAVAATRSWLAGGANAAPGPLVFGFWAFAVLMLIQLIWRLCWRESLILGRDMARYRKSVLLPIARREAPVEEVQGFRASKSLYMINGRHQHGIEMKTAGVPVRFGFGLPEAEIRWLVHRLIQRLGEYSDTVVLPEGEEPANPTGWLYHEAPADGTEILHAEDGPAPRPEGTAWRQQGDMQDMVFRKRGHLDRSELLIGLAFCVILNGGLSLFWLFFFGMIPGYEALDRGLAWWGVLLLLIPFQLMGLWLIGAIIGILLAPLRRTTWRFGPDCIVRKQGTALLMRTHQWPVEGPFRLELRRIKGRTFSATSRRRMQVQKEPDRFELVIVTGNNEELCRIPDLDETEARWMAGEILKQRGE